ncbi:hypothetical protein SKAU_G00202290 [Synaphobranchus kaupii]|uniref:Uncharacterized protein n=1 Tax=Synaphobranchus kaupii TaxID=118154 RepID=A0A9Q1FFQ5_SYNKA|nr:hypothetical protein SKAU_G00202290 [Synaphobranchus kaupii]
MLLSVGYHDYHWPTYQRYGGFRLRFAAFKQVYPGTIERTGNQFLYPDRSVRVIPTTGPLVLQGKMTKSRFPVGSVLENFTLVGSISEEALPQEEATLGTPWPPVLARRTPVGSLSQLSFPAAPAGMPRPATEAGKMHKKLCQRLHPVPQTLFAVRGFVHRDFCTCMY